MDGDFEEYKVFQWLSGDDECSGGAFRSHPPSLLRLFLERHCTDTNSQHNQDVSLKNHQSPHRVYLR